ncbi:MAG: ABC transporter permease subunit [Candidatus Lokiarchaeota archaeon]|nr:ABC transporter permease subunit [Candidatus Lokiarchaeota archaeon]
MKVLQIIWKELKVGKKGIIIYAALMSLFYLWFVSIYDPDLLANFNEIMENYPEAIQQMVGEYFSLATFGGFVNVYLLSMSFFFFGVYFILRSSSDIPKEIENKTIDLMLSKPITRWEITLGKYFYHIISATIVLVSVFLAIILGIFIMPNINPIDVNFTELWTAFFIVLLFNYTVISTAFFFSTFNNPKMALVFSFGLVIFFYAVGQFWNSFDESIQGIKYISIFYYSDMSNLLVNSNWDAVPLKIIFLSTYSIGLTALSVLLFNKRDIPV